jgi:hypothetical protein
MTWAMLDRELDHLVQAMLDCTYEKAHAIGTALDSVAGRCTLLKLLSNLYSPSNEWRDLLKQMLNHICNNLAPRRNRLVHDWWMESPKSDFAFKIDRRVKTQDVEDERQRFLYNVAETISVKDIDEFNDQTLGIILAITVAARDLRRAAQAKQQGPQEVSL